MFRVFRVSCFSFCVSCFSCFVFLGFYGRSVTDEVLPPSILFLSLMTSIRFVAKSNQPRKSIVYLFIMKKMGYVVLLSYTHSFSLSLFRSLTYLDGKPLWNNLIMFSVVHSRETRLVLISQLRRTRSIKSSSPIRFS